MKTILAPVDFSAASEAVLTQAIELARALAGRVVLLTVIQPPVITSEYAGLMENLSEVIAAGERNAARRLGELEARVRQILEQAERLGADFIVMGSHGHTALYDLLVGSTTHGVLLRAPCPVVITPGPKAAKAARAA